MAKFKMSGVQIGKLASHAQEIEKVADELREWAQDFRDEWDQMSERWRVSDVGQATIFWIECLEELADSTTDAAGSIANADEEPGT